MESDPSSPAWGRWPNQTALGGPGWTPLPTHSSFRSGSIISISPRGSLDTARRGSLPGRKESDISRRRSSLGVPTDGLSADDMSEGRRRSSGKSLVSSRRRSSVMSNGTVLDPIEENRMKHLAGIGILARRFSELVEVIAPFPGEDEGLNDVNYAREMISRWSPWTTETDVSEIMTAPYVPTPQLAPVVPTIWSNYPLSSVAQEYSLNTPEMNGESEPSPVFALRMPTLPVEYTPPPPREPTEQLRARSRPGFARASTDYIFPTALPVQSIPAAVRPAPRRAISTPQLPFIPWNDSEMVDPITVTESSLSKRCPPPTGSFPLARSHPLGLSKLRESTRRTSTSSELDIPPRRPSIVAERRISIVQQGSRRASASRKFSRELSPKSSRRPSIESVKLNLLAVPRKGSISSDPRKDSIDSSRRPSSSSRKSSTLSLGEYTYLADEIDPTVPVIPVIEPRSSRTSLGKTESLSSRRNAPPSITLPTYHFPTSPSGPLSGSSTATPRYNPIDTFLGRTPALSSSGSTFVDPLSPRSDITSPSIPHRSVIDRGRPVSASPEIQDAFPHRSAYPGPYTRPMKFEQDLTSSIDAHEVDPKTPRSPSYRFPVTCPGPERKAKLAPSPMPLKSILVHRSVDLRIGTPVRPQPQRASTFESNKDIQAILRSRHEPVQTHARGSDEGEGKKARPTIKHQSSFTRLFHRAKSQSPASSS